MQTLDNLTSSHESVCKDEQVPYAALTWWAGSNTKAEGASAIACKGHTPTFASFYEMQTRRTAK